MLAAADRRLQVLLLPLVERMEAAYPRRWIRKRIP